MMIYTEPVETDWKKELFDRLDIIGTKLGQGAGYLWHVLVKQGIAVGLADATFSLLALGFLITGIVYVNKFGKLCAADEWGDDGYVSGLVVSAVVSVIALLFFCSYSYDAVLELANPEYFALHEVLKAVGK